MDPAKYQFQSEFARRYISLGKEKGRAEGKVEGKAEGRAQIVTKLLVSRFGRLPATVKERIRAAGVEELDRMAVRVLTAKTLAEVLAAE